MTTFNQLQKLNMRLQEIKQILKTDQVFNQKLTQLEIRVMDRQIIMLFLSLLRIKNTETKKIKSV